MADTDNPNCGLNRSVKFEQCIGKCSLGGYRITGAIKNKVHHDFLWDGERTEGIER